MASKQDVIEQCQFVVKSFLRFDCLRAFLESAWRFYPGASVLVVDDSLRPGEQYPDDIADLRRHPDVKWMQLPFHSGLSAGRNVAVQNSAKPYVVLCDDDFVLTEDSRIEDLLSVVQDGGVSLAAGTLFDVHDQCVQAWRGRIIREGRSLRMTPPDSKWEDAGGVRFRRTDAFYNFFVATTESLLAAPWDDRLKVSREHIDFLLQRIEAGLSAALVPSVTAVHDRKPGAGGAEYAWFRQRLEEENRLFFQKWDLDEWHYVPASPLDHLRPTEIANAPVDTGGIVVMGVGHSGTTIVTQMLAEIGYRGCFDGWYEDERVRRLNDEAMRSRLNVGAAREILDGYSDRWVIKDPRFIHTLDQWLPLFNGHRPTLVWVTRDIEQVKSSYRRRNEVELTQGKVSIEDGLAAARRQYEAWPWAKFRIDHADLCTASALIKPTKEKPMKERPTGIIKLDVGGGMNCREGFTSIDRSANADICHDLEVVPWPLADDSVEELWSSHTMEHVRNKFGFLYEIARVCRVGAAVTIRTPHPNSESAMTGGHVAVISESDLRNICEHFADQFWPGAKRLRLLSVRQLPNGMWMERAKQSGRFAGWSDDEIMTWVPRTAHENEFVFEVVER